MSYAWNGVMDKETFEKLKECAKQHWIYDGSDAELARLLNVADNTISVWKARAYSNNPTKVETAGHKAALMLGDYPLDHQFMYIAASRFMKEENIKKINTPTLQLLKEAVCKFLENRLIEEAKKRQEEEAKRKAEEEKKRQQAQQQLLDRQKAFNIYLEELKQRAAVHGLKLDNISFVPDTK